MEVITKHSHRAEDTSLGEAASYGSKVVNEGTSSVEVATCPIEVVEETYNSEEGANCTSKEAEQTSLVEAVVVIYKAVEETSSGEAASYSSKVETSSVEETSLEEGAN
ncbi:hypothetical protein CRG98_019390 [Punica granatum]|uniref:Uncharacterized protein n=1 Tax=Punica granatum TaxID=22663 RepID=A0A2I0JVC1_PUNGR|nr:hypothetical protein CRG98_019390 [Punica granatum]